MQRAAAASSPVSTPQTSDIPSPKRQKLSAPAISTPTPASEIQAIQAALKEQDDKISQAVDRLAAEAGETKWSLSFVDKGKDRNEMGGLRVVTVGYSYIDTGGAKDVGRRKFGNFKNTLKVNSL